MSSSQKQLDPYSIEGDFDTPEDHKLLRKVDLQYVFTLTISQAFGLCLTIETQSLLPILTLLYLLSFLDRYVQLAQKKILISCGHFIRSNIGNAKLVRISMNYFRMKALTN